MNFYIGQEIADLHYGWQPIMRDYDVGAGAVEWYYPYAPTPTQTATQFIASAITPAKAFSAFLAAVARSADRSYTNKMLMIVAEPDHNEYWTAAWSYDGTRQGVCKIKPKEK